MSTDAVPLPSYEKAILQTVVYKQIRETVNAVLKQYQINTTQWMILGVLKRSGSSRKISAIAHELQVEVPLITTLSQALVAAGQVTQTADVRDRRSKPLSLTEQGSDLVGKVEAELTAHLQHLETGIAPEALADYFKTMRKLIANAQNPGV